MQDWKMRDQNARVKNAGLENAGKDSVWNTVHVYFCSVVQREINPAFHDVKELVQDDSPSKTLITQLCRYVQRQ